MARVTSELRMSSWHILRTGLRVKGPCSWMCSVSGSALAVLFVYSQSTSPSAWETPLSPALAFPWANVSNSVWRLHELIDYYDVCKLSVLNYFYAVLS